MNNIRNKAKTDSKIYVVCYHAGQYEDSVTGTIQAYETKEDAEAYIKERTEWQHHVEETAIKDPQDTYWNSDESDESYLYSKLRENFRNNLMETLIPGKNCDDYNDDDWIKIDCEETDENFKKYMIEVCGYSEDVADCTLIFNECGDYGEYHYYYFIDEIDLIKKK